MRLELESRTAWRAKAKLSRAAGCSAGGGADATAGGDVAVRSAVGVGAVRRAIGLFASRDEESRSVICEYSTTNVR